MLLQPYYKLKHIWFLCHVKLDPGGALEPTCLRHFEWQNN